MKKFFKIIAQPFINIGISIVFPHFKNRQYFTFSVLLRGVQQKFVGSNKKVKWPVHFTSVIIAPEKIIPGTKAPGYAMGCFIDGRNGIVIGENVWIGPRVSLISQNHEENNFSKYTVEKPIVIGKNSLLTANCIVLPGVELGEHTIVAAGAVITKSFLEGNQVLGGVPAKVIKKLEEYIEVS